MSKVNEYQIKNSILFLNYKSSYFVISRVKNSKNRYSYKNELYDSHMYRAVFTIFPLQKIHQTTWLVICYTTS